MRFQPGITGLLNDTDKSLQGTNLLAFRSHCYLVSQTVRAKVQSVKDRHDGLGICNFAMAIFEFSDSTIAVLLNVVYPVIGFVDPPAEGQCVFEYKDCPRLAEAFGSFGDYIIPNSGVLKQPVVREMYKDLWPGELKAINYFRPYHVGDVIFNYWD